MSYTKIASMFKERDNPSIEDILVGKVISLPIKVSLYDGCSILDEDDLIICERLSTKISFDKIIAENIVGTQLPTSVNATNVIITKGTIELRKNIFEVGDSLLLLKIGESYIVVDRLVKS